MWINREHAIMGVKGYSGTRPEWTFGSMKEFTDVMEEVHENA